MYIKKGYQTEECLRARKETAQRRRQNADEKYRHLFYELGLDETFDYIGFEKKDLIWFRCKKCGLIAPRGNDVFKGRQAKLLCRACGNGMRLYSPFVDEVLSFYQEGHSVTETSEKYGINKSTLNDWVKSRKVSNGRDWREAAQECNKARAEACIAPHDLSYYARAKIHGAPAEIGVTLKKLIERNGLTCALCGLPCFYYGSPQAPLYPTMDHIIPISKGGGHTWENVQVAHRVCNLNKSNKIGKEWNNGNG